MHGASVITANCGAAALKIVEGQDIDILISDLAMPDGDGYCLIERVRAAESATRSRALPAIAITAFAGQNDEQRTLAAGFDCHVAKPVNAGDLARIVTQTYTRMCGRTPRPCDATPAA